MNKEKTDDRNIVLESGFAFKAENVKYHQKGKIKVNFHSNRKKDITESKNKKNLPDKILDKEIFKQVEKNIKTTYRIVE